LIGDAPAKSLEVIKEYRGKINGDSYWTKAGFPETHYLKEVGILKGLNIPIHSFYLNKIAKTNFEEIAKETKGKCSALNIDSVDGAETLT
jgi:hypothetical protein